MPPEPTPHFLEEHGGRPNQRYLQALRVYPFLQSPVQPLRLTSAYVIAGVTIGETGQSAVRRVFIPSPMGNFLTVERGIVVLCCTSNGVMLWGVCLDNGSSWAGPAASPSGYLAEKLKGAFTGAKIRKVKDGIGGDYPHQSYLGKVQSLGKHLCADKNVCLVGKKGLGDSFMAVFPSGNVSVPAQYSGSGEIVAYLLFYSFGADAQEPDSPAPAFRTIGRDRLSVVALVAY